MPRLWTESQFSVTTLAVQDSILKVGPACIFFSHFLVIRRQEKSLVSLKPVCSTLADFLGFHLTWPHPLLKGILHSQFFKQGFSCDFFSSLKIVLRKGFFRGNYRNKLQKYNKQCSSSPKRRYFPTEGQDKS